MKRIKIIGVALFVFLTCSLSFQCSEKNNIQKVMEKEAATVNSQCPVMLDKITRLDRCEVIPPKTFKYYYTSFQKDSSDTISIKKRLEPIMIKAIKNQVVMEPYRKSGVIFQYIYNNPEGEYLFQIKIGTDEYNK